jgi:hypothetical protein
MTPHSILLAILAIFPHMSGNNRQCIMDRQQMIATQLQEVSEPVAPGAPVPPVELTAAVAFAETHLGCDLHEGGNWGAPIDRNHRHTAGTHLSAVRVLSRGYERCGSWDGAILRFRTGLCNPARQGGTEAIRRIGPQYLRTIHSIMDRMRAHQDAHGTHE